MSSQEAAGRYLILSSDAHAGAPMAAYKAYLDPSWHEEFDAWLASVRNPWVDINDTRNFDSADRIVAMDAEGVTGEVLFPNTLPPFYDILAHLSGVPRTREQFDRRWAGLSAHNRWLVDFCAQEPLRRRGLVQLLPNDVDAAVAEVRWAADHEVIGGVMLPAVPPNHAVEPYFHARYDPLWEAVVEHGFAVHQHQGSGSPDVGAGEEVDRSVSYVNHELWTRLTLSHLIVGGVFERHPDLRVVWTEMPGLRWVVEDLERITRQLKVIQSRYAGDPRQLNFAGSFGSATTESLSLTPLEYFRRNCYIGASLIAPYDVRYIHVLGTDRIMWGHDFPHPEGSSGRTTDALRLLFADFPDADCRQMLTDTAAEVYHFDPVALAPIADRIGPPVDLVHTPLTEIPVSRGSAFAAPEDLALALDDAAWR